MAGRNTAVVTDVKYVDLLKMSKEQKMVNEADSIAAIEGKKLEILILQKEAKIQSFDTNIASLVSANPINFESIVKLEDDKAIATREITKLQELKTRLF